MVYQHGDGVKFGEIRTNGAEIQTGSFWHCNGSRSWLQSIPNRPALVDGVFRSAEIRYKLPDYRRQALNDLLPDRLRCNLTAIVVYHHQECVCAHDEWIVSPRENGAVDFEMH